MRRVLAAILCCVLLCMPVYAAGTATSLQSQTTVASDGSCQVTLVVSIHVDSPDTNLVFPLPGNAANVTLNGTAVRTRSSGEFRTVDLSGVLGGVAGDFSLTVHYTLTNVVGADDSGRRMLELPILCGFAYPVEQLQFTVTLPGEVESRPSFTSAYLQESVETEIGYAINGAQISGLLSGRLMDRETLTMTLAVSEAMFPEEEPVKQSPVFALGMGACLALAALYWLIFLRCAPLRRIHRVTPPAGVSAGEAGCRLVGAGADLSLMVVTWAQLGYLYIDQDDAGRVFLHRRMAMGNERSAFENRCFRRLFGKKRTVDGTGYRYARLCREVAEEKPNIRGQYQRSSGNPAIFRILCCGVGAFSGAAIGAAFPMEGVWPLVLSVVLGLLGGFGSWLIQKGCCCLHLRRRKPGRAGLICVAVWLALAGISGTLTAGLVGVLVQILGGLAAAYGGRRTEAARRTAGELLGLRHYLKTASPQELRQMQKTNPDYYYQLAPYALALGVDKRFARRMGRIRLPSCPYLTAGREAGTPGSWYLLLRETVDTLDAGQKRLSRERFGLGR